MLCHLPAHKASDVIMQYAYGRCDHRLEADEFSPEYIDAVFVDSKASAWTKQMFWVFQLVQSLPDWLTRMLSPGLGLNRRMARVSVKATMVIAYRKFA